jgi:hypothetical protein
MKKAAAAPRPFSSNLSTFVSSSLVERLTDTTGRAALRIGSQTWSTHQLATVIGVVNTRAARLLTQAADSIGAKNLRDLYQRATPYTFAMRGVGVTTLYVLWRLFESHGFDPEKWATAGDTGEALTSFLSLKKRERDAERRTIEAQARHGKKQQSRPAETSVH